MRSAVGVVVVVVEYWRPTTRTEPTTLKDPAGDNRIDTLNFLGPLKVFYGHKWLTKQTINIDIEL